MADGVEEKRPGGVFIPYDKLFQQQSDKLDKILEELRDLGKTKLDVTVFDSFRSAYEQKHEVVLSGVRVALDARERWVPVIEQQGKDIDNLQQDKAERDAVKAQMRYYLAGGGLVGLLVLVNLAVNAWQLLGR